MSRIRVLVVDDHRDSADSLAMLIRCLGCEVQTAYDGPEAIFKAAQFKAHVAFIDLAMPRMTGLRLIEALRNNGFIDETLCVAISGYTDTATIEAALQAGFGRFLAKPCTMINLQEVIEPLCRVAGRS